MKIWKRIAALSLAGAMCVSLFGCGKKDDQGNQKKLLAKELGFGYIAEYKDLDAELEFLQSTIAAGGKIYLQGYYYDEENYENSGNRLYELNPENGETTSIPMPTLQSTDNSSENVQAITVSPDGSGYWAVIGTYTYSPVGEAEPEPKAVPADEETPDGDAPAEDAGDTPAENAPEDAAPVDAEAGLSAGVRMDLLSNTVPADDAEEPAEAPAEDAAEAPVEDGAEAPAEDAAEIPEADVVEGSAAEDEIAPISMGDDNQQESYAVKKFDMNGELLQEIDLNDAAAELEWFYCQNMAQDADGNLYIAVNDGKILCYDKDGKRQADIDLNTYYVQSLVTVGSGAVMATYYETEGNGAVVTRLEKGSASEPMHPEGVSETGNLMIYGGDGDAVLLSDGNLLYRMNTATGETTKLLSWLDSDINASNISGVAGSEDTLQVVLSGYAHNSGEYTFELGTLTKTKEKDLPQRTVLTMGAQYLDEQLRSAVVDFNRKSDTYRITLVDYSTYNTTDDYTLAAKQLDMDVISGNSPDIISLQGAKVEQYISKGVLTNLSELLEKDETISETDLMSGPLQGFSKDGKLYGMPCSFNIQTLYGSAMRLGERTSWTIQEMAEVIGEMDEDAQIMSYTTQSSFLSMMLMVNLPKFVDYSKATCSFDSEEFKSLLQAAADMPEDPKEDSEGAGHGEVIVEDAVSTIEDDEMTQLQRGDTLLANGYVYSSYEIKNFLNLYIPKNGIVNIGFPTDSGSGVVLRVDNGLAISDKCQNKDGAWEFIKSTLTDDFQGNQWSLPVTVSAFDAMMEKAKEPDYYMEKGEKVYVDSTAYIGQTEYKLDTITDEQIQEFKDYINGASMVSTTYDSDLMDIVTEEAEAFFAGDKSVDEVADLIQSRASIYLGETS